MSTWSICIIPHGVGSSISFGAVVCRWRKSGRVLFAVAVVVFSGTAAAAFWLATMHRANIDIIFANLIFFSSLATTCTGMIIVQKRL